MSGTSRNMFPVGLPSLAIIAGATTPAPSQPGALAWSSTLACAMIWTGAAWWIHPFTSPPVTVAAATYTVATSDTNLIFTVACTVTLPTPANFKGRRLNVKVIGAFAISSASANVAPIASATAGTPILTAVTGKYAELVCDGTNWIVVIAN